MGRSLAAIVAAIALLAPAAAFADPPSDVARAEALFRSAKQIRDAGQYADACPLFEESSRLAPGVGVLLYLGDCEEHVGKTASAWGAFREAETRACQHDDKRGEIARSRAVALERKLSGLTILVPAAAASGAKEILLDGAPVAPQEWNVAVAVDPGDHTVTVRSPGRVPRTLTAHVDAGDRKAQLSIVDPVDIVVAPSLEKPSTEVGAASDPVATRHRWMGVGLLGAGAVGIAVGTTLLLNQQGSAGTASDSTAATAGAVIAFAAGGAALAAGLALTVTLPTQKSARWLAVPLFVAGGGGAGLSTTF